MNTYSKQPLTSKFHTAANSVVQKQAKNSGLYLIDNRLGNVQNNRVAQLKKTNNNNDVIQLQMKFYKSESKSDKIQKIEDYLAQHRDIERSSSSEYTEAVNSLRGKIARGVSWEKIKEKFREVESFEDTDHTVPHFLPPITKK